MKGKNTILLVDDDPLVLASMKAVMEDSGFHVMQAETGERAVSTLQDSTGINLVLCDMNLPGISGLEVLEKSKSFDSEIPVIIITAFGSVDNAVQAMRGGANDYMAKPVDDFELIQKVKRSLLVAELSEENQSLRQQVQTVNRVPDLVARHQSMESVLSTAEAVSSTKATVLIHGESGTGKTMLARVIHSFSDRSTRPFVEMSCGSLPDPLLESELFGFERGAFTGAERSKPGKFEVANGGTLFLDEIANATPALQVKLLRILQDRIVERLGANETREVDVRLVLATNADLDDLVKKGQFREDLFYRINVVNIYLPPLRERQSDIRALIELFVGRYVREHSKTVDGVDQDLLSHLETQLWPGNVRELENVVEHMVVLSRGGPLEMGDLPARYRGEPTMTVHEDPDVKPLKKAMEQPEREYIRHVLRLNSGNRQKTADMLNVNRTTLFNKMKKHDLFSDDVET